MSEPRTRRRANAVYLIASIAGLFGCILGFTFGFLHSHGPEAAVPIALGAFAITLAAGGWIHERDSRWKTWRSIALGLGAVSVEPVFAAYPYAGYVVIAFVVICFFGLVFGDWLA